MYDGIVTRLPLTFTCPWRTNWRAWLRLAEKPARNTTLSRRSSSIRSRFSPVMPCSRAASRVHVAELLLEHAVDAARLLLLAELEQVLAVADATTAVLAGRVRLALHRAAHGVALRALEEQLHPLATAELADGTRVTRHRQTLRRFGGRQPLCGIGVTSLMPTTSMPVFWMVRIAVSRPEPGPFTTHVDPAHRRAPSRVAPRSPPRAARRTAWTCVSP